MNALKFVLYFPCTLQVWRKPATTASGKRIAINWADCAFTLFLHSCLDDKSMVILINIVYYQTVAPLSHSSLVLRPPPFLPSVCIHNNTQKWSSTPVYYCEHKWRQNVGGLGTRLVTLSISKLLYLCFVLSIFSLSYSRTDTCALTKNALYYASQNCAVINDHWPKELSSPQIPVCVINGISWIGNSYEAVYMSAVILLHRVCDACEYQKWTPQSQSDSCCQHSYAHACSIGVCVNMFLHCMYYAQMYAALLT